MEHPNKRKFIGILPCVGVVSAKSPSGARGHKVFLTEDAVKDALNSFVGMGINMRPDGEHHNATEKIGVIEESEISGNSLILSGYLFSRDIPDVISRLEESSDWGLSYESVDSRVENMRADVYVIKECTFTGAAIVKRNKAAYEFTEFILI